MSTREQEERAIICPCCNAEMVKDPEATDSGAGTGYLDCPKCEFSAHVSLLLNDDDREAIRKVYVQELYGAVEKGQQGFKKLEQMPPEKRRFH